MRLGRIPGHCGIHSLKYLGHFSNIRYTLTQPGQKHWKVFLEIQLPLPFKVQRRIEIHNICTIHYTEYNKEIIISDASKRKIEKEKIFLNKIIDIMDVSERIVVHKCLPKIF